MKITGNLIIKNQSDAERFAGVTSVGGYLDVRADFQAPVLTSVGGYLDVRADFQAPVLTEAIKLADDGNYQLWFLDGTYRAGCRNFSAAEGLAHWNRTDERAKLFRAAILNHSGRV